MNVVRSCQCRLAGSALLGLLYWFVGMSSVQAGMVAIGPFSGSLTERWESRPNHVTPFFHFEPTPTTIMGGGASVANGVMGIYENPSPDANFFIGIPGVAAQVSDGVKGLAISGYNETASITFATPVRDFGAYWGSGSPSNGVTVTFFDEASEQLGDPLFFSYTRNGSFGGDGGLDWHGWRSTTAGIKRVTSRGDFVVVDGLQANPVPEPASLALLLLGTASTGCLLGFRRRVHRPSEASAAQRQG